MVQVGGVKMFVDSFKYLPSSLKKAYQGEGLSVPDDIPFTPTASMKENTVALITTAGIWDKTRDTPFDYQREKRNPTWGDPDFRMIRKEINANEVGAGHLHLNNEDILKDFNIVLPIRALQELEEEKKIGRTAKTHYSFMGYQGRPADLEHWLTESAPQVLEHLKNEGVNSLVFSPT
jgi:hypothetical protein